MRRRQLLVLLATLGWVVLRPWPHSEGRAQAPAPGPQEKKDQAAPDLITRYRFLERYALKGRRAEPGLIDQYRVAFKETLKTETETARGTPRREEWVRQAIFAERPAAISSLNEGLVTDLVRRYDKVHIVPNPWARLSGRDSWEGLTLWLHIQPSGPPRVMVLSEGRPLMAQEYRFATDHLYVPDLGFVLPELPSRVGDTWRIPRQGTSALVDSAISSGVLTGRLMTVRPDPDGLGMIAVIDAGGRLGTLQEQGTVHGRPEIIEGKTAINARLEFAFPPPSPTSGTAHREEEGPIVDARGAIIRVRLAQVDEVPQGPDSRLRRTTRRELVLERHLGAEGGELIVPDPPPQPTVENSWLLYLDPEGRYHFRFPQEFQVAPAPGAGPGTLALTRERPEGGDMVMLDFRDKAQIRPEEFFQSVLKTWKERVFEVLPGATQVLPEADFPDVRVHRTEAAMKVPSRGGVSGARLHL
ncbi:MAG: hypothetical protein IRY99_10945, partial [Isosphaeraceae bacterium]|nr:hypothetical protein [Isosphaeraceae bacterium]